jgi:polysaccharide pyruvyl transferase CsaB
MSDRHRVLVSGYYGFGNAGDEAVLAGLIVALRELAPEVELTVLSGDPAATEAEHGVAAAPRGFRSARRCLQESDLLISGGGGLLQDATSWRSPLYYLQIMRLARAAGVPVACVGQSIGPLRRRWVRWLVRRELSQVEVIAVRDRGSAEVLRALGASLPVAVRLSAPSGSGAEHRVEVTTDLTFALPRPGQAEAAAAWAKAGLSEIPRPVVGIAVRRPVRGKATRLAVQLASVIGLTCRKVGIYPVLVPMHCPRDLAFAMDVQTSIALAFGLAFRSTVVKQRLTARELLALTMGFDLLVAMRLHALIFAAICGVSPVAISYDPKVDGLMADLGLAVTAWVGQESTPALDQEALAAGAMRAWLTRHEVAGGLLARAPRLRQAALRNVELALPLLRRRE